MKAKEKLNEYREIYNRIQSHNLLTIEELRNLVAGADFTGMFGDNIKSEVMDAFRKCENANCEYTMYRNQLFVVTWLGKTTCESFGEMMRFEF